MSNIKKDFDSLLQKEMDRKDFLKMVGVAIVAMTGVASLLKTLSSIDSDEVSPRASGGYGSSAYGGAGAHQKLS